MCGSNLEYQTFIWSVVNLFHFLFRLNTFFHFFFPFGSCFFLLRNFEDHFFVLISLRFDVLPFFVLAFAVALEFAVLAVVVGWCCTSCSCICCWLCNCSCSSYCIFFSWSLKSSLSKMLLYFLLLSTCLLLKCVVNNSASFLSRASPHSLCSSHKIVKGGV